MYQAVLDPASGKWRLSSPSAQPLSRLAAAAIRAASITCAAVSSTRFDMCGQVPADLEPIPRPPTLLYLRLGSAPGVRRKYALDHRVEGEDAPGEIASLAGRLPAPAHSAQKTNRSASMTFKTTRNGSYGVKPNRKIWPHKHSEPMDNVFLKAKKGSRSRPRALTRTSREESMS